MSARDVIAAAIWQYELDIVGTPAQVWETWSQSDPETAAIYQTHAGCVLAAISAAGWVVVPREPTLAMCFAGINALQASGWQRSEGDEAAGCGCHAYRAMIAAALPAAPQENKP